jgi:SAM-dependent methyltransferase
MHNHSNWLPTKFVNRNGQWRASRNSAEVGIGSRIIADLVAHFYQRELAVHANGRLLDLGCGKAPLLGIYQSCTTAITTMDWAQSHGGEFVDICHDISRPLPLDDGSFDTVVLSDVLEHMPEPLALLQEIHRIMQPGGTLLLNVPFYYWLHETPHDYYRFTRFGLADLAAKAQFQVVVLTPLGGAPEVFCDLVGKMVAGRQYLGWIARCLPALYQGAMRFQAFRRYAANSGETFPLAYGMVLKRTSAQ